MTTIDSGMVDVWVPVQFEAEVRAFVADLVSLTVASEPQQARDSGRVELADDFEWDEAEVRSIAVNLPWDALMAFLDELALHPGQWVRKRTFEEESGVSASEIRTQLGTLTKVYLQPVGKAHWFFDLQKGDDGFYLYRMASDVASWWSAARGLGVE